MAMKSPPVKEGEEYNVTVESLGTKGDGIAKIERYTIFVPGTRIGDSVRVRITKVMPQFAFSEIINDE